MVDIRDTQYNLPIGTDTISRQAAIVALGTITVYKGSIPFDTAMMRIEQLPPAQPKRINGRWIPVGGALYQCDQCGAVSLERKFCSECGADMREVTE